MGHLFSVHKSQHKASEAIPKVYHPTNSFNNSNLCPVSSLLNTAFDGVMSYPMDIFDIKQYNDLAGKYYDKYGIYNCTSSEKHDRTVYHSCSSRTSCPLSLLDIEAAQISANYTYKHSLCHIRDRLKQNSDVNVIILGGSVTKGAAAEGCCCDPAVDHKCPKIVYDDHSETGLFCSHAQDSSVCRWSSLLMRWFRSISKGRVHEIYLAEGGATSVYMAENIGVQLRRHGIEKLTDSDIILIDHSVNDGMAYSSQIRNDELSRGLESFIRRILHHTDRNLSYIDSLSHSHNRGSWPTIILLEMWPYPNEDMALKNRPSPSNPSNKYDYIHIYRRIAQEYNIPIWSYRDLVWNETADSSERMRPYIEYLRFLHNVDFGYQHPPWFVHLFYADLLADLFTREFHQCDVFSISGKSQLVAYPYSWTSHDIMSYMNVSSIRNNHHIIERDKYCMDSTAPLLDVSSNEILHGVDAIAVGNYSSSPNGSWPIYEDHPGKSGWIDMSQDSHTLDFNSLRSNDVVRDICNISGESYASNLTFSIDVAPIAVAGVDPSSSGIFIISIHYLRTYFNAGQVDVFLCGKKLTTLDALWTDFETYHYSYTNIYTYEYNPMTLWEDDRYCTNLLSASDKKCRKAMLRKGLTSTLEFRRRCVPNRVSIEQNNQDHYKKARDHHKFKLISVRICQSE